MIIRITLLEASILIVSGIILGMTLNAIYAAAVPGQLPEYVTPAYIKLILGLAVYVIGAVGIYLTEGRR